MFSFAEFCYEFASRTKQKFKLFALWPGNKATIYHHFGLELFNFVLNKQQLKSLHKNLDVNRCSFCNYELRRDR